MCSKENNTGFRQEVTGGAIARALFDKTWLKTIYQRVPAFLVVIFYLTNFYNLWLHFNISNVKQQYKINTKPFTTFLNIVCTFHILLYKYFVCLFDGYAIRHDGF